MKICSGALALSILLTACSPQYSGDGVLSDAGIFSADRYVLDLGPIDLARSNETTYRLSNLPEEKFTLGLLISGTTGSEPLYLAKPLTANIQIEMRNERGELVIATSGALRDWTWSGSSGELQRSFVYRALDSERVQLADQGSGTYFRPRGNASYTLTVSVLGNDPAATAYHATLGMRGGDWK